MTPQPISPSPLAAAAPAAVDPVAERTVNAVGSSVLNPGLNPAVNAVLDSVSNPVVDPVADRARRFGGVARLYGDAALRRFEMSRVAIIGIGGVGSWAAEALARSAIGGLTLIDLDNVGESNTNRQLHALDGNYGMAKVDAMAQRIRLIDPACDVRPVDDFVEPGNFEILLGQGFDYIVDAIDDTRTKTALIAWCVARRQPIITVGGAGGQTDPTRIRIDDLSRTIQDPLLAKVRSQLRRLHGFPRDRKRRFDVAAVYSDEPLLYPETSTSSSACAIDGDAVRDTIVDAVSNAVSIDNAGLATASPAGGASGLNCAGFGSSVCVTASFGLAAASHVLRRLALTSPSYPATTRSD